jgi:hypothetical protein
MRSKGMRDLKADWRRWSWPERIAAVSLMLIGSFASAVLTVAGAVP